MKIVVFLLFSILCVLIGGAPLLIAILGIVGIVISAGWAIIFLGIALTVGAAVSSISFYLVRRAWRDQGGIVRDPLPEAWKNYYPQVSIGIWRLDGYFAYEANGRCYLFKTLAEAEQRRAKLPTVA